MKHRIKLFLMGFVSFLIIDGIWLSWIIIDFYKSQIGFLMPEIPIIKSWRVFSALGVYVIMALGLVFLVWDTIESGSPESGSPESGSSTYPSLPGASLYSNLSMQLPKVYFKNGFILGFSIYGVYELTNLSVIQGWPLPIVFVDTLWGGLLCGSIGALVPWLAQKLKVI